MSRELGRVLNELSVQWVLNLTLDCNNDSLRHLVACNNTDSFFSKVPRHDYLVLASAISLFLNSVSILATFLRDAPIDFGFSNGDIV